MTNSPGQRRARQNTPEAAAPRDASTLRAALQELGSAERARQQKRFFQAYDGGYGEGDQFLGIRVPELRSVARRFRGVSLPDAEILLRDPHHEVRLTALFILVEQFERGEAEQKDAVVGAYLHNLSWVNNWDLVDSSAPKILGPALLSRYGGDGVPEELWTLARSGDLWRERVAVLATFAFIRAHVFGPTLELAEFHLHHPYDLMHKAIGWMLREIGNRDIEVERRFLVQWYRGMPRTMLRYAIEKFPETERKSFLNGTAGSVTLPVNPAQKQDDDGSSVY